MYMKTLLMIESAFMRFKKRERQACLLEATTYLQAIQTEETELLTFGGKIFTLLVVHILLWICYILTFP